MSLHQSGVFFPGAKKSRCTLVHLLACGFVWENEGSALRREQSKLAGAGNRLRTAVDVQLAVDIAGVLLDRAHGNDQLLGNRLVRVARGNESQHFQLTGS